MSPKIPAKVFLKFFMVSSVSSPFWVVPDPWRPNMVGPRGASEGSVARRPPLATLLTVLDWDAVGATVGINKTLQDF